jgi:hypothetical protein
MTSFSLLEYQSGSALSIHDFIVESFSSSGLDMEFEPKLVGFCSDGESNMQGK